MIDTFSIHLENNEFFNRSHRFEDNFIEDIANRDEIDFLFDMEDIESIKEPEYLKQSS